jgi:DNA-binding IclR family transcriptional regulator
MNWLARHDGVDLVPGFVDNQTTVWGDSLEFYYAMSLARLVRQYRDHFDVAMRSQLRANLVSQQQADGSWRNANKAMREDDPLLATALGIAALATLADADQLDAAETLNPAPALR